MMMNKETIINKDAANSKLRVVREFDAPLEIVWKAWTDKDLLDAWWAPKPWKAETKSLDFREGGAWLYCMVGPEGEKQWCRVDYTNIVERKSFSGIDAFCDEEGNRNTGFPQMNWKTDFFSTENGAKVEVEITFKNEADMQTIIDMGFEEGFTAGLGNLDELLAREPGTL